MAAMLTAVTAASVFLGIARNARRNASTPPCFAAVLQNFQKSGL